MPARLSIGLVARRTGATVPGIRYYEEVGLLPVPRRTESGQRHYDEATVDRLLFIRRCRAFGFSLEQVRELVTRVGAPQGPCSELRDVAAGHLTQVRARLVELAALEASLTAIVDTCNAGCAGGAVADCSIPDDLTAASKAVRAGSTGPCCG